MGGGAARSSAGKRAPTTNHNIMASSAKILQLETESKALGGKKNKPGKLFSSAMAVLGCDERWFVLPERGYPHLPPRPGRLPETRHGEREMLHRLFPVRNKLWGRQAPALLLPSFVPAATAGFFQRFPPKAGLGEVCKTKASPPRAEPGWRSCGPQKCLCLRKEHASPLPFLPPLKPKLALVQAFPEKRDRFRGKENHSPPKIAQQVSLQGSSKQGDMENSVQRLRNPQEGAIQPLFL